MDKIVYAHLDDTLAICADVRHMADAVVNAPFAYKLETTELSLGIVVLLVVDQENDVIHRVALSQTELADRTREMSVKKFEDIKIPLDDPENLVAEAVRTGRPQHTTDWHYLFVPALTTEEARLNQAGGAISASFIYPLRDVGDGAVLIFSYYEYISHIGAAHKDFMRQYTTLAARHLRPFAGDFPLLYAGLKG